MSTTSSCGHCMRSHSTAALAWMFLGPLAVQTVLAQTQDALRNWFDDPYVRLVAQDRHCPPPAGPFATEQERLAQSHRRAEKGSTAWLAGESDRPQAYAYDADIAGALVQAFRGDTRFAGSSLWATVQGRVVYIEGCLSGRAGVAQLEAKVRALAHVQQAIAIVRTDARARPPYREMPAPDADDRGLSAKPR